MAQTPQQTHPGPQLRDEPKVYFSNERTFISWLNFAILLSATGVWLLRPGATKKEPSSGWASHTLVGVSCEIGAISMMAYALFMFLRRAASIRRQEGRTYDMPLTPVFATVLIVSIIFAAIAFSLSE